MCVYTCLHTYVHTVRTYIHTVRTSNVCMRIYCTYTALTQHINSCSWCHPHGIGHTSVLPGKSNNIGRSDVTVGIVHDESLSHFNSCQSQLKLSFKRTCIVGIGLLFKGDKINLSCIFKDACEIESEARYWFIHWWISGEQPVVEVSGQSYFAGGIEGHLLGRYSPTCI